MSRRNQFIRVKFFLSDNIMEWDSRRRLRKLIKKGSRVLDLGALSSPYTQGFDGCVVIGMDLPRAGRFGFSTSLIEKLRAQGVVPVYGDGTRIPFPPETFDIVILTEVIEHVLDDTAMAENIRRVLKPHGKVFITTPNAVRTPVEKGIHEHVRHYRPEELAALFRDFNIVQLETRFKGELWWYFHLGRNSLLIGKLPRWIDLLLVMLMVPLRLVIQWITAVEDHFLDRPGDNIILVAEKPGELG